MIPGFEEERLGAVYDVRYLKRLWPFLRPYGGLFALSLVLGL